MLSVIQTHNNSMKCAKKWLFSGLLKLKFNCCKKIFAVRILIVEILQFLHFYWCLKSDKFDTFCIV